MMMIRKMLAKTIKPTEEKTIENVLKKALKYYLLGVHDGLCNCMADSLIYYRYITSYFFVNIIKYIPEFTQENAIKHFNGRKHTFWWPIEKWWPRYRFMKWLIKKYKGK